MLYKRTSSGYVLFKLGDLGLARVIPDGAEDICWADRAYLDYQQDNEQEMTVCGTPRFMAPEV